MAIYRRYRTPGSLTKSVGKTKRLITFTDQDMKEGRHLAKRHFQGNFSEMVRVLIRAEMEREIGRTK